MAYSSLHMYRQTAAATTTMAGWICIDFSNGSPKAEPGIRPHLSLEPESMKYATRSDDDSMSGFKVTIAAVYFHSTLNFDYDIPW